MHLIGPTYFVWEDNNNYYCLQCINTLKIKRDKINVYNNYKLNDLVN